MSQSRPDPRKRPPDPAGTQPKVDPASLRGALTAGSGEHHERGLPERTSAPPAASPASSAASSNGAVALAASATVLAPTADRRRAMVTPGPRQTTPWSWRTARNEAGHLLCRLT